MEHHDLSRHPEGMILDEVQNAPDLLSYIQGMVDDNPERRFILSGSSQFSVLKKISQSLAGRIAILELLPFSFSEVKSTASEKTLISCCWMGSTQLYTQERISPRCFTPRM